MPARNVVLEQTRAVDWQYELFVAHSACHGDSRVTRCENRKQFGRKPKGKMKMKPWTPLTEVGDFSPAGFSIYSATIAPPKVSAFEEYVEHRVAVLWDEDRDERVLAAL